MKGTTHVSFDVHKAAKISITHVSTFTVTNKYEKNNKQPLMTFPEIIYI